LFEEFPSKNEKQNKNKNKKKIQGDPSLKNENESKQPSNWETSIEKFKIRAIPPARKLG